MADTLYLEHNSIRTAYTDTGGPGIPLVLVHGYTGSKLDFRDEIPLLSRHRRVINIDQRGHGESTNSGDTSYTLDLLVDDLDSFITSLGIGKLDILGHSLGGMVVMRYVVKRPERVRSLILMDTSPGPIQSPMQRPEAVNNLARSSGVQSLLPMMKSQPVSPGAQRGIDFLGEKEHYRRIETKLQQMDPEAFIGLWEALIVQEDFKPSLASITCPTTILVGEEDEPFRKPSKDMADSIGNSNLVVIPLAAHCPQYENAPVWREAMTNHLDKRGR